MDIGLRKAWVEELRKKFAGKRVNINLRGRRYGSGEFKEVFLTGYDSAELRLCVLMDGSSSITQFHVQCTPKWNDGEIRWKDNGSSAFIARTVDGEAIFELESNVISLASLSSRRQSRKGLAPGLTLVNLQGRKGVAPALKN